jgi:hypothetical protein
VDNDQEDDHHHLELDNIKNDVISDEDNQLQQQYQLLHNLFPINLYLLVGYFLPMDEYNQYHHHIYQ